MSPSLTHLNLEMNPLPLEILKGISKLKTLKELSLAGIPNTFTLDSAFTKSILEGGMKSVKLTGKYIIGDSLVLPTLISHFSDKQLSISLDDRENVNNSIDVNHSGQSRLNFSINQTQFIQIGCNRRYIHLNTNFLVSNFSVVTVRGNWKMPDQTFRKQKSRVFAGSSKR